MKPQLPNQEEDKVLAIQQWIDRNAPLLKMTKSVKITIHIKGSSVSGEITQFPDSK